MAGLVRFRNLQKLVGRYNVVTAAKTQPIVAAQKLCRYVGTSGTQKSETAAATTTDSCNTETKPQKYWVSHGFSEEDKDLDDHLLHLAFFVSISIVITGGAFLLTYMPDFRMKDWALREAYLELRRREAAGLPPIDPNLIDPVIMAAQLPTDEEIGDQEVII